jgi:hypothetical protein
MSKERKKDSNIDQVWSGFVYAELLDKFLIDLENSYDDLKHFRYNNAELSITRDKNKLNSSRNSKSKFLSTYENFLNIIHNLVSKKNSFKNSFKNFEGRARTFRNSQNVLLEHLEKILPKAEDSINMSWPPPAPAHLTINSFVALSLRIHTEYPTLKPKTIILESTRRTIIPVLAHWICISGESSSINEVALSFFKSDCCFDKSDDEDLIIKKLNRDQLAWQRVSKVLVKYSSEYFGKSETLNLLSEIINLVEDYRKNPHGGELWMQLGKLNGTPPGVNQMVIFECLKKIQVTDEVPNALQNKSTFYCSRTRHSALRLGYYDEEFKNRANKNLLDVAADFDKQLSKLSDEDKLARAFILSRIALVNHDNSDNSEAELEKKKLAAKLFEKLLQSILSNKNGDKNIHLIAYRYLLGFLTNPRFTKAITDTVKLEESLSEFRKNAEDRSDKVSLLLSDIFKARLNWARALSGEKIDCEDIVLKYANSCNKILSVTNHDEAQLDSEAPMWIIPELSVILYLGENFCNRPVLQKYLNDDESGISKENINASVILTRIAETQFGIYYHHSVERNRIINGLLQFAEVYQRIRVTSTH